MSDMAAAVAAQRASDGPVWWWLRQHGITARRQPDGSRYWQTGGLVARIAACWPRLGRVVRALCRRRGHEWSVTEWGWDGGPSLDVWCRWCDATGAIPISEMPYTHRKAFDLWNAVEEANG